MANPQIENGHTKIANEIMEALSKINLSPYEMRVLLVIMRKTYGWGKKSDKIPLSQIVEITGIAKPNVSRAMKSLVSRSIVISSDNKRIGVNKNHDQWLSVAITPKKDKKLSAETPKVISSDNKKLSAETPQKHKALSKEKIEMPEWMDVDKWNAFVEMRNKRKKPLTEYAKRLAINSLIEMRESGQPIDVVMDKAIMNSWLSFYPLKQDELASYSKDIPLPEKECEEI